MGRSTNGKGVGSVAGRTARIRAHTSAVSEAAHLSRHARFVPRPQRSNEWLETAEFCGTDWGKPCVLIKKLLYFYPTLGALPRPEPSQNLNLARPQSTGEHRRVLLMARRPQNQPRLTYSTRTGQNLAQRGSLSAKSQSLSDKAADPPSARSVRKALSSQTCRATAATSSHASPVGVTRAEARWGQMCTAQAEHVPRSGSAIARLSRH